MERIDPGSRDSGIAPPPAALIAAAIVGFVGFWGLGRYPLWLDEAWRACSVSEHDPVMTPLMPPLYHAVLSLLHPVLGRGEWVFRLPSAIAGAVACAIAFRLASRWFSDTWAGLFAVVALAANPIFIEFARSVKEHYFGTLYTLLALWALDRCIRAPTARSDGLMALVAFTGPLFAHSSAFPVFAAPAALSVFRLGRGWRGLVGPAVAAFAAAIGTAISFFRIKESSALGEVVAYFEWVWPPPDAGGAALWVIRQTHDMLTYFLGVFHRPETAFSQWLAPILLLGASVGVALMQPAARRAFLACAGIAAAACVAAAMFRHWPYGPYRMMIWLHPALVLPAAGGLAFLARTFRQNRLIPALVLLYAVALAIPSAWAIYAAAAKQRATDYDFRRIAPELTGLIAEGDAVLVTHDGVYEFRYYCPVLPDGVAVTVFRDEAEAVSAIAARPENAVWLISAHIDRAAMFADAAAHFAQTARLDGGRCTAARYVKTAAQAPAP